MNGYDQTGIAAADEHFQREAQKYANYLETPEGRLRIHLALVNLQQILPTNTGSLQALDIGGGTGTMAVCLARLGVQVTLLDPSLPMLDFAKTAAQKAGVAEKIVLKQGDAAEVVKLFPSQSFDLILCHNVLEFVDDPSAILSNTARVMRGPSAILSILVRSQAGEVIKTALQTGDLAAAKASLTAEWGQESLYGGKVRLFTPERLQSMIDKASLAIVAERGVRVFADYLPPQISRTAEYQRIFDLELELGKRPEFTAVARYIHFLARPRQP